MKKVIVLFFFLIEFPLTAQIKTHKITGKVTHYNVPLVGVKIQLLNSETFIFTDINGDYEVLAKPKDVLIFSHIGMQNEIVIIEDVTSILNIKMTEEVELLDNVTIEKKVTIKNFSQRKEFKLNKTLFNSAFGYFDSKKSGFTVYTINEEDINPASYDILSVIRGRFPSVQIKYDRDQNAYIYIRAFDSRLNGSVSHAIFDIDGMITNQIPDDINISNIDRIALIDGRTAYSKYGGRASGGVVIINTKSANFVYESGTNKAYDYAKRRDNIYIPNTTLTDITTVENQLYLNEIKFAKTFKEAKAIYSDKEKHFKKDPYFYLEMGEFFEKKWKKNGYQNEIYNCLKEKFYKNAEVLKALAYLYEKERKNKLALPLYGQIFNLRPKYAQSNRDMANIYLENNDVKNALRFYALYNKNIDNNENNILTKEIDSIVRLESANLVLKYGEKIKVDKEKVKAFPKYLNSRILLEWNNSQAEFDLQIINPKKHHYTWSHTRFENEHLLLSEKIAGYSSKQIILDNYLTGAWQINIKYYGNKGINPTYLKLTVYFNYGKPNQTKTIKVYKLRKEGISMKLASFNNKTNSF